MGGLRVKIGHHKIGACAEIGQNRIRGEWGVKKTQKTSDIIYVRSHMYFTGCLQICSDQSTILQCSVYHLAVFCL